MKTGIPSGMRDLSGLDVVKKRDLQKRLMQVFRHCGYQEVMTPAIEYLETYSSAFSSLKTREMYKFFDENSEILALRMDMTVPIARMAATRFKEAAQPLRFCYASSVWKVRKAFAGKRSEVTDCGVELIGEQPQADLEVLFVALQALDALNLQDALLEISDVNFFFDAARTLLEREEDVLQLASLIDNKSIVELEAFLNSLDLLPEQRSFFLELPLLSGGPEVLVRAAELAFTPAQEAAVKGLASLYDDLSLLDRSERIRIDLGKLPHLDYYTGLIFEGYQPGVGTSILSGGRYDHLLESFGHAAPAVGFSVKIDSLAEIHSVSLPKSVTVRYPKGQLVEALRIVEALNQELPVQLEECEDPACVRAEAYYES